MKVGDLVELSAEGQKIWHLGAARGKTGIVVEICKAGMYPIIVFWFRSGQISHRRSTLKLVSKSQKKSNIS